MVMETPVLVPVEAAPLAIQLMLTRKQLSGKCLLKNMAECSRQHNGCRDCEHRELCCLLHDDYWIEADKITNWQGSNERLSRYYE